MAFDFEAFARQTQQLTPTKAVEDKPWYDDAYETGRQVGAGFAVDLPRMAGQAMRWAAPEHSPLNKMGRAITEDADERAPGWEPDMEGRGLAASTFIKGGRAVGPMATAIGASMVAGPVAGAAVAGTQFGMSSAQDTEDKLRGQGVSDSEATAAGWKVGAVQGPMEGAATLLGLRAAKALGPMFGGSKTMGGVVARATDTSVLKPLAKNMGLNLLVQPATEVVQDGGTELIERGAGAAPEDLWEIAKDSAQGGIGLTLLLGPFAAFGQRSHAGRARALKEALYSENTPEAVRNQARDLLVAKAQKEGVAPDQADAWLDRQFVEDDARFARNNAAQEAAKRAGMPNVVNEPAPLQERIDAGLGMAPPGARRKGYEAQFEAAASEGSGQMVQNPEDGQERELSMLEQIQRDAALELEQKQAAGPPPTPEQERNAALGSMVADIRARNAELARAGREDYGITKPGALETFAELEKAKQEGLFDDVQFTAMAATLSDEALGLSAVRAALKDARKQQQGQAEVRRAIEESDAQMQADAVAAVGLRAPEVAPAAAQAPAVETTGPSAAVPVPAPAPVTKKSPGQDAVERIEKHIGKKFTPLARSRLFTRLGFDVDGHPTGVGMRSLEEVAAVEASRSGKAAVSRQSIEGMLKQYGMTDAMVEALGRRLEMGEAVTDTDTLDPHVTATATEEVAEDGTAEEVVRFVDAPEVNAPHTADGTDWNDLSAEEVMGDSRNPDTATMRVRKDLGSGVANKSAEDAAAHSKTVVAAAHELAKDPDAPDEIRELASKLSHLIDRDGRVTASNALGAGASAYISRIGSRIAAVLAESGDARAEMFAPPQMQAQLARKRAAVEIQRELDDAERQAAQRTANERRILENMREVLAHPEAKNARVDWDDSSTIAWADLSMKLQSDWVLNYIENLDQNNGDLDFQSMAREQGRIEDEHKRVQKQTPTGPAAVNAKERQGSEVAAGKLAQARVQGSPAVADGKRDGAAQEIVVGKPNAAVPVAVKKKRRVVAPAAVEAPAVEAPAAAVEAPAVEAPAAAVEAPAAAAVEAPAVEAEQTAARERDEAASIRSRFDAQTAAAADPSRRRFLMGAVALAVGGTAATNLRVSPATTGKAVAPRERG